VNQLSDLLPAARVFDLSQTYFPGMPHFPTHPPFLYSLTREHGEHVGPEGHSSAADALGMGSHCGTHIDALCHFSVQGKLFSNEAVRQSYAGGQRVHAADTIAPILRRAILLDIAGLEGVEALPQDFEVTPQHLDAATDDREIHPGDIVLLRTGWAQYWTEPARFVADGHGPGPSVAGAGWLSQRHVFAAGSDTLAFEKIPSATMPVHVHLLVEKGIHIIECLNLEELARARISDFVFIAAPLKSVAPPEPPCGR